jgi:2-desacetyl-2-hydroxyethyl bacteriochlorophyllide A dehydrogenase
MRALLHEGPGRIEVKDFPRAHVCDGAVEIAVEAAAICGLDLKAFQGKGQRLAAPQIPGHELVGRLPDGRRVVADPLLGCGRCAACRREAPNQCARLRLLGMNGFSGCFAEYVVVEEQQVYPIPNELDDLNAVWAEPLANVVHLFGLAGLDAAVARQLRVGIVGAGTMGSLAVQLALHLGARAVLVEDVDARRLASARQMGATTAITPEDESAREFAQDGLDLVIDACGTAEARQEAFALCRSGGTVALLGMAKQTSAIDFGASIRKEHRVAMSFGYTPEDFSRSLALLIAGAVDMRSWTAEMPLEEGQKAFERMTSARGDVLKMVLRVK